MRARKTQARANRRQRSNDCDRVGCRWAGVPSHGNGSFVGCVDSSRIEPMARICPRGATRKQPPSLSANIVRQNLSVLILAMAAVIFLSGSPGMSQSQPTQKKPTTVPLSDSDVRPFAGSISDYRQYPIDAQVQVGDWIYKINRASPMFADKHLRHSEFGPFGDSNTMVLAIEIIVRNIGKAPARLPSLKVITKELVGTNDGPQPQLLEYDQYSAGYIERHLTSSVVFNPSEQLMGVIAFECCINKGAQMAFLRISDGVRAGKSALISLSGPAPPPSHVVCESVGGGDPHFVTSPVCRTVLDSLAGR